MNVELETSSSQFWEFLSNHFAKIVTGDPILIILVTLGHLEQAPVGRHGPFLGIFWGHSAGVCETNDVPVMLHVGKCSEQIIQRMATYKDPVCLSQMICSSPKNVGTRPQSVKFAK